MIRQRHAKLSKKIMGNEDVKKVHYYQNEMIKYGTTYYHITAYWLWELSITEQCMNLLKHKGWAVNTRCTNAYAKVEEG